MTIRSKNGMMTPRTVDEVRWSTWKPKERAVLCLVRNNNELLLIHKKTGLGAGKINAPGGRIEPNETPRHAAIRETEEETGIIPLNPEQRAELSFIFTNGYSIHGTIFLATTYSGTMIETPEALPFWRSLDNLPFERMWEDDKLWLPKVLHGAYIKGFFIFDEDCMLSHKIEVRD